MEQVCSRCERELPRPLPQYSNYVMNTDLGEPEPRERFYAMMHTDETRSMVEGLLSDLDRDVSFAELSAAMANPDADDEIEVSMGTKFVEQDGGETETTVFESRGFSIDEQKFDHVRVESPSEALSDPEVAHVYSVIEQVEVQKTGIVCRDCTDVEDDVLIWGPDAE